MKRRNFLGAGLAGITSAFVSRKLTVSGEEIPEEIQSISEGVGALPSTEKFLQDRAHRFEILRICHHSSVWANQIEPGHWFRHVYGEKDAVDLGKTISCIAYQYVGDKAMRFKDYEHGGLPAETYTDPSSKGFQDIVKDCSEPYPKPIGCLHGSVFIFTDVNHQRFELFCSNNSMRRFGNDLNRSEGFNVCNIKRMCNLKVVERTHSKMGFKWYAPKLQIV